MRAVVFDVGETLVDETRHWTHIAQAHGTPLLTFFGVLGGLIERRQHHRRVHEVLGHEPPWEPWPDIEPGDFYPDALPCLRQCKEAGLVVGLAGNQPASTVRVLGDMGLGVDFVASSATWGVEKPSPEFFARVVDAAGLAPAEIAYVGDRVDNDVMPARAAGMAAVFVVRGPWGWLHKDWPEAASASLTLTSLDGLASNLKGLRP